MAGALADAAVGNNVVGGFQAEVLRVDFSQFVGGLEGGVLVGRNLPRHTARAGYVAAAQHTLLRILGHVGQFAGVFLGRTHVDQGLARLRVRERLIEECADLLVKALGRHGVIRARVASLAAIFHGTLRAPGTWPPRSTPSCGYSGMWVSSPVYSLGELTH